MCCCSPKAAPNTSTPSPWPAAGRSKGRTRTTRATPSSPTATWAWATRCPASGTPTWCGRPAATGTRCCWPPGCTAAATPTWGARRIWPGWNGSGPWPVFNPGEGRLTEHTDVALPAHPWPPADPVDHFDAGTLGSHWNLLRGPATEAYSLAERPGHLRLRLLPRTLSEQSSPAFVGRRQQHIDFAAEAELDFAPGAPGEAAGLAVLQSPGHHVTLLLTAAEDGGTVVRLTERKAGSDTVRGELPVRPGPLRLGVRARGQDYTFSCSQSPEGSRDLGTVDGRFLSSQVAGGFTGVCLGPYATGPAGGTGHADYDWFRYGPAAN
ncbi:hypothetical protein OG900_35285 [Streptomyces sp. NBC_00433]